MAAFIARPDEAPVDTARRCGVLSMRFQACLPAVSRHTSILCSGLCETAWDAVLATVLLVAGLVVFCQHATQASAGFQAINAAISSDEHDFDYFWNNTRLCVGLACGFAGGALLGLGYMAGLFRGPWRADTEPCAGFRVPRARGGKRGGAVVAVLITLAALLFAVLMLGACALGSAFAQTLAVGSERATDVRFRFLNHTKHTVSRYAQPLSWSSAQNCNGKKLVLSGGGDTENYITRQTVLCALVHASPYDAFYVCLPQHLSCPDLYFHFMLLLAGGRRSRVRNEMQYLLLH